MKIVDGQGIAMGRLASYVAKEALKGEDVIVVNCEKVIITGNKRNIQAEIAETRSKIGSGQKGPKISRLSDKIVGRAIRGMLPTHRQGRGREAWKRIKCFIGVPAKYVEGEKVNLSKDKKVKYIEVREIKKQNG